MTRPQLLPVQLFSLLVIGLSGVTADAAVNAAAMAESVTIHRDEWGVPHIDAPTDAAVAFGMAYAQCEDFFWQVEDSYILSIGRNAEVRGNEGVGSDYLQRVFEITRRAKEDYEQLDADIKAIADAYAAGLNYYLKTHPDVKPRLITQFEPWYLLAYDRFIMMGFMYGKSHAPRPEPLGMDKKTADINPWIDPNNPLSLLSDRHIDQVVGSNQWAIAPSKTASGNAMLFVNPHQPWYGAGQFYEAHVKSDQGLHFSGSCFYGSPFPSMGHNEHLGWCHTVNEPDVADVYRETFDDPTNPLNYKYGDGYRQAATWNDVIRIRTENGIVEQPLRFLKTHHGPVVKQESETSFLTVKFSRVLEGSRVQQGLAMAKASNLEEWIDAVSQLQLPMFNCAYADRDGNIFYLYNGAIPIRDPSFDWTQPVDGSDPRTEWQGLHPVDQLPQVLNPPCGWLQNCNSTPYITADESNPALGDYPRYMVEEFDKDRRRAKVSRKLLREAQNVTYDDWQKLAFDTTLYWPMVNQSVWERDLAEMQSKSPELATEVEPYLSHLLDWNCVVTNDCTRSVLCAAWYATLYGDKYPAETISPEYRLDETQKYTALVKAAKLLEGKYKSWQVAWGDLHRLQRVPYVNSPDGTVPFLRDDQPSLPCVGAPGPMGVAFTVYCTPDLEHLQKRYAVVGASFVATYEFGDRITADSLLQFGVNGNPDSPHYFDQAKLLSERKLKKAWFYEDEVKANTVRSYHPGETELVKAP
ncbi:MAG: penicillin acylase family protein [Planctomycetaceae bacterium]|nr:penicillin acylase family protein [Planctomycetaceae bacterium]